MKDKNASHTHYTKQCTQVIIIYQSCSEQKSFHILSCYGNFKILIAHFASITLVMTTPFYGVCHNYE